MADDEATNDNASEDTGAETQPMSLDTLHETTQEEVRAEETKEAADKQDNNESSADNTEGEESSDESEEIDGEDKAGAENSDDTSDSGGDDDAKESDNVSDADDADSKDTELDEKPDSDKPTTELDTDISKDGKYKVKFVDIDDNTYFVNNATELPDDFEPKSYKEFAVASQQLPLKQAEFNRDQAQAQESATKAATDERINKIQQGWDKDIERLTKSGSLPKDEKERTKVTDKVFSLMEKEMKDGNIIDSFNVAYRLYKGEQSDKEAEEKKNEIAEKKKQRGGMVQGSSNNNRGAAIQAPPSGMSLDAVHEQTVGSL